MSSFFRNLGKALDPKRNGVARAFDPKRNGVSRTFSKIGSQGAGIFHKAINDGGKIFNKQNGEKVLNEISHDLGEGASVASTINKYGNEVLNNPILMGAVAVNPELQPLYAGLKGINTGIGLAGQGANALSNLTNKNGYSGNAKQVTRQVIEKAVPVVQTGIQAKQMGYV